MRNYFIILIFSFLFLIAISPVLAVDNSNSSAIETVDCSESIDCTGLIDEAKTKCEKKEKKCKELEKKADKYEKIITLKQNQQNILSNQLNVLHSNINEIKTDINKNTEKLENLNEDIADTIRKITEKESDISTQKKLLTKIIRSYHENQQNFSLSLFIGASNFLDIATGQDHLHKTGMEMFEMTSNLRKAQAKLLRTRKALDAKKNEAIDARNKLNGEKARLAQAKIEKNSLLVSTKGDEKKYEKKLARIAKQKLELLGDIDDLYNNNLAEINNLVAGLEKPTSGLASTSWYYSQKDSRWGGKTIGHSKSLMKDYGCAISDVAMVFTFHNKRITPGKLCKEPIFYWDLISWPDFWHGLKLAENTNHSGVSWAKINREIKNKNPVIVFINAGRGGHYVVIHGKAKNGKYVVHDPYWGANVYLGSSLKLLGSLYKKSLSTRAIDQMILYK